jgi:putative transposase
MKGKRPTTEEKFRSLRVPPTRRKQVRRGASPSLPTQATHRGHVWTWDFIADAAVRGGALRLLTNLDEHTRGCHVLRADLALKVQRHAGTAGTCHPGTRGAPGSAERQRPRVHRQGGAAAAGGARRDDPLRRAGQPVAERLVESFHGRFGDGCLNREQLHTLTEARVAIEDYRREYNRHRPQSRLGYLSPERFAQRHLPSPVAVGLRPPSTGDGQTNTPQTTSASAWNSHLPSSSLCGPVSNWGTTGFMECRPGR